MYSAHNPARMQTMPDSPNHCQALFSTFLEATLNDNNPLAADILRGAAAIADHLGFPRRTIYHLTANGTLPTFRMGDIVCARKSTLTAWIASQEARAA
jgi:excisionase family DNA binding protein